MIIGLLFWLLTFLCCYYAIAFGGKDGRRAAALLIAAPLLTIPILKIGRLWNYAELAVFIVDFSLLVSLYVLMLASRRYWLIWMTGFHLIAVVTHLSAMVTPVFTPQIYRAMESVWAIPMLLSMLLGINLDRKAAYRQ